MFKRLFEPFVKKRPDAEALDRFMKMEETGQLFEQGMEEFSSEEARDGYLKLARIWTDLESYPAELDSGLDISAADLVSSAPPVWSRAAPLALAASFAVAMVSLLSYQFYGDTIDSYQTGRGERLSINLADGSLMLINARSRVSVTYSKQLRMVKLKSGEALFEVVKDPERSFVVATDKGSVKAIGTRFNVNLLEEQMVVSVAEGKVLVGNGRKEQAEQAAETAVGGQQVAVDAKGVISSSKPDSLLPALAWIDNKIMFAGETLQRAVEQINRNTKHKISILDPKLRELQIHGVFNAGDYQGFLSALEKTYPLTAVNSSINHTYLVYRRKS